jgi:carbamoyl-phosphate synthase large subunit
MMLNILVTGVGSIIGYNIIDGLQKSTVKTRIIGVDIYEDAYGGVLCDKFIKGVRADSDNFIDFINQIISDNKIDLIFPGIEQDLYKLWTNKEKIKTKIVLNNDLCLSLSSDKLKTFEYLSKLKINLIPTLHSCTFAECVHAFGSPFLIKPFSSSASKGIEIITNEKEFEFYTYKLSGKCIYQKIIGTAETEFTISTFGNGEGDILDNTILRRTLSKDGSTNKASLLEDDDILQYVKKLCAILKPAGPLNIQVRKEGSKVYLLEINPRISSACSIRTLLGYNEPEMCLKYFLTKETIVPQPKIYGKVVRYIADYLYKQ